MLISTKKISIVIPVYNGARTLEACLASVLDQSIEMHECIIVDNNSKDDTKNIVETFQKQYQKLTYLFEPTPGRGAARNAGIYKTTGDIIVMTDVDCVVPHNWLEQITAPIRKANELVVVGGEYDMVENYWSRNTQKMYDYLRGAHDRSNQYTPFIDTKNFAIDAKLLKKTPFDNRFKALEDEEIMFRLRTDARFLYLRDVKVGHKHAQSMRSVMKSSYERSFWFAQIYHKFKGVYDKNGILIFAPVTPFRFYTRLPIIDWKALKIQGFSHLLYFIVYDFSWKAGSAIGYARMVPSLRLEKQKANKK